MVSLNSKVASWLHIDKNYLLRPDLAGLRRPSTAPLPSHLPQESRSLSPDFFFMPPFAADDLTVGGPPDFPTPSPLQEAGGSLSALQQARRPSRDAFQTHFALETGYGSMDQYCVLPKSSGSNESASWCSGLPVATTTKSKVPIMKKSPPKILRPPNAWILYRSDKLAEAKSIQGQRTPQAELSKHIAESWRSETPEVKREYERQAELRKLQHEAQHPGQLSYMQLYPYV